MRVCVLRVIQLIPRWRTYVEQSTFASRLFRSVFARAKFTADADVGLERKRQQTGEGRGREEMKRSSIQIEAEVSSVRCQLQLP